MTTLITVGNSEGKRRCDARCHDAKSIDCDCVCGGMNHGKGEAAARENTQRFAEKILSDYKAKTGEDAIIIPQQAALFA
ncbi:MAG: hypothetical protein M0Z38_08425 [Deltaproteobacteria bacterium]|nr:hypothetical protein [Deltaproteobacteria bacterium]